MTDLSTRYLGLDLTNPIIVGSCGLTRSVDGVRKCADAGAGAVVLKSIFEEQIAAEVQAIEASSGHSAWHPEAADYISAYGREGAVGQYIETVREASKAVSIPIIASIHCVSAEGWTDFARRVEQAGADALELNVFVMPSDPRQSGVQNEQIYFDIVEAVTARVKIPISLKLGFFFSSVAEMLQKLGRSGIAGMVLFNRFYNPDIDIERFSLHAAEVFSTPDEYLRTLRWISIMSGRVGCDLAAATGIHDGETVIKQLLAGANAVQVCSALYRNDLGEIGKMLQVLEEWMGRHDYASIADFRGKMSQSGSENPAAYSRVQFMKTSVGIE